MPKARGCERPGEKGDPTGAEATGDPPWGRGAWVGVAVLGWSLEPEPSRVSQQGSAEMP